MPFPKNRIFLATAGACACFFVLGFVDNLKGATLPAVLATVLVELRNGHQGF